MAAVIFIPAVFVIAPRQTRLRLVGVSVIALFLCLIWLGPVSSALHVEKSPIGKWNALCVVEQQITRCTVDNAVSEEDRKTIFEALPGVAYRENLSDIARGAYMTSNRSLPELVFLYFEMGVEYPRVYFDAFLWHTEDAWSPFSKIDCYSKSDDRTSVFSVDNQAPATHESLLPGLFNRTQWLSTDVGAYANPITLVIVLIPLYVCLMLFALLRALQHRDGAALAFVLPLAVLALSNFFGPCMLIRYFLYLFMAAPLLIWNATRQHERVSKSLNGKGER